MLNAMYALELLNRAHFLLQSEGMVLAEEVLDVIKQLEATVKEGAQ